VTPSTKLPRGREAAGLDELRPDTIRAIAVPHPMTDAIMAAFDGVVLRPVAVAPDADAVTALLREGSVSDVLLDLREGIDLAREIGAQEPEARLIGLLGEDAVGAPAALAAGVFAFLSAATSSDDARAVLAGRAAVPPEFADAVLRASALPLKRRERELAPRAKLVSQARRGIEAPGALRPVFQPIAKLAEQGLYGYLALTRFTGESDERTGRRFAEAHALGLGMDLELAAARAALSQLERFPDGIALFIKLSCSTLADDRVIELVELNDAPRVVFELVGHPEPSEAVAFNHNIAALRDTGIRFSVDETGASFGALDRMLDLAPNFVRLARGLTRDIDTDRTRRALALAVTSFATHLGARVIADAVETAEELSALKRMGVTYGLGFHIGRPGPLPEIAPVAPAEGDQDAIGEGGVLWAKRPKRATLSVGRSPDFESAVRNVLRSLGDRIPGSVPYVAFLDREAERLRIVDVGTTTSVALHPGATFDLAESYDLPAADGSAPQIATVPEEMAPVAATLGLSAYGVVPFAGSPERPMATVSLAAFGRTRIHPETIVLLQEAGALIGDELKAEHGTLQHKQEHALRLLSWRDRFSGLNNATRFHEELEAANARPAAGGIGTFALIVKIANFRALTERMGVGLAELVLKDAARGIAAQANSVDVLARVGAATFGGVLHARRPGEVEFLCSAVEDLVLETGRRRGATVEVRTSYERLGQGVTAGALWADLAERVLMAGA
jgi:EAL domain-containing protein (putative c-di-GMP-specific phosphodiesterase class I)/GGDEF domain-containing protein